MRTSLLFLSKADLHPTSVLTTYSMAIEKQYLLSKGYPNKSQKPMTCATTMYIKKQDDSRMI